jgi:hypothetical protein
MIRVCYVDTDRTGGGIEVTGAEGTLRIRREDPHGVIMLFNGQQLSITKNALADIGKFFLAAAIKLGEDIDPSIKVTE